MAFRVARLSRRRLSRPGGIALLLTYCRPRRSEHGSHLEASRVRSPRSVQRLGSASALLGSSSTHEGLGVRGPLPLRRRGRVPPLAACSVQRRRPRSPLPILRASGGTCAAGPFPRVRGQPDRSVRLFPAGRVPSWACATLLGQPGPVQVIRFLSRAQRAAPDRDHARRGRRVPAGRRGAHRVGLRHSGDRWARLARNPPARPADGDGHGVFAAIFILVANVIVDLVYSILDPRIEPKACARAADRRPAPAWPTPPSCHCSRAREPRSTARA